MRKTIRPRLQPGSEKKLKAKKLKGIFALFLDTIALMARKIFLLFFVMIFTGILASIIAGAVAFVFSVLFASSLPEAEQIMNASPMVLGAIVIMGIIYLFLYMWVISSVTAAAVHDRIGLFASIGEGFSKAWPLFWVMILFHAITTTGFILFIVPGIILSVYLLFAPFTIYDTRFRGINAIAASYRYVKGRWWSVFIRLVLMGLVTIAVAVVSQMILMPSGNFNITASITEGSAINPDLMASSSGLIPAIAFLIINILCQVFILLFVTNLYRNLRQTAPEESESSSNIIWWLLAILGPVITLALMFFAQPQIKPVIDEVKKNIPTEGLKLPESIKDIKNIKDNFSINMDNSPVSPSTSVKNSQWLDPVGDVEQSRMGKLLDIKSVSVKSKNNHLTINIETSASLSDIFRAIANDRHNTQPLATIYFDTDNALYTGTMEEQLIGRAGYDMGINIELSARQNKLDNGIVIDEISQVNAEKFRIVSGQEEPLGLLPESAVDIKENRIILDIPYSTLDIKTGDKLRMSYYETYQAEGDPLSTDKIIDL